MNIITISIFIIYVFSKILPSNISEKRLLSNYDVGWTMDILVDNL